MSVLSHPYCFEVKHKRVAVLTAKNIFSKTLGSKILRIEKMVSPLNSCRKGFADGKQPDDKWHREIVNVGSEW